MFYDDHNNTYAYVPNWVGRCRRWWRSRDLFFDWMKTIKSNWTLKTDYIAIFTMFDSVRLLYMVDVVLRISVITILLFWVTIIFWWDAIDWPKDSKSVGHQCFQKFDWMDDVRSELRLLRSWPRARTTLAVCNTLCHRGESTNTNCKHVLEFSISIWKQILDLTVNKCETYRIKSISTDRAVSCKSRRVFWNRGIRKPKLMKRQSCLGDGCNSTQPIYGVTFVATMLRIVWCSLRTINPWNSSTARCRIWYRSDVEPTTSRYQSTSLPWCQ